MFSISYIASLSQQSYNIIKNYEGWKDEIKFHPINYIIGDICVEIEYFHHYVSIEMLMELN